MSKQENTGNYKIKNILLGLIMGGAVYFLVNVFAPNTVQPQKGEQGPRGQVEYVVDGPPLKQPNTLNYTALGLAICIAALVILIKPLKDSNG